MRAIVVMGATGGFYYWLYGVLVRYSLNDASRHPRYHYDCPDGITSCTSRRMPAAADYGAVWMQLGLALLVAALIAYAILMRRREKAKGL